MFQEEQGSKNRTITLQFSVGFKVSEMQVL